MHDPVIVPVPGALTAPVDAPTLPAGALTNGMLAAYILQLRAALGLANQRLAKIRALAAPAEPAR